MKSLIFLENNDSLVSGPGITLLKKTFEHMFERGAPVQDDFTGFNKIHYRSYLTITSDPKYSQSSIPVSMANGILSILARYQNTQITDYKRIKELVEKDIKDSLKIEDSKEIVVYTDAARQYGKIKVYVPGGIDKKIITKIKNLIVEKKKLVKVRDNYGAMQYPVFKYFNTDKNQLNTYYIHQDVIDDVLNLIKSETGIDYRVSGGSLASLSTADSSPSTQTSTSKDINIIGIEETSHGKKIAIQLNVDYDKSRSIYDSMKAANLVPRGYSYVAGRPPKFLIAVDSLDLYNSIKQKLIDGKVDVSDLDKFVEDNKLFSADSQKEISFEKKPESIVSAKPIIKFSDPSNGAKNSMTVNIPYTRISPDQKAFLKELVQYSFPGYEWDGNNYAYIVSGNFKQYAAFGQILKKFGYHVEDLRTIVTSKLAKGGLERADYEGKVSENFKEKIDERLPECKFEIYDKQKDGIAFLHGRNNAILGDETGFGKTLSLVAAAELKMQDLGSNSKTLVLTLKAVQKQWVEEIKNVIGTNAQISENGTEPKRWTVLYYDNFSSGKNLQKIIDTTKNAGYNVVIFDELHKLKHSTSKRSQNLEEATGDIPYKWGASATISANRAMDVRNQLVMVGHPLGKISESKFKRDFAGMIPGGYRGAYTEGTFEDRIRAAEKLNKWLNLSGVYVRRTKDELREMPNLSVGTSATPIDQDKFERDLREKLRGYKDPELAISELIASREILANLKVDHTVETAIDIIKRNINKPENNYAASKVVIFTNFTNPGKHIYEKLSSRLKEIDPNFKVLTYLSMTKKSEREKVKEIFTNDKNTKALVMSMKMGGTGISFPNASQNMIINDFDWTPESAEQSEGRIYRINTDHPVNITYTLTDGLDTELFTIVQRKRKLAEMIQKYRKEYQEKEIDESLIQKIVDAQKKMQDIDEEIKNLIAGAAAKAMKESYSFRDYLEFFNI